MMNGKNISSLRRITGYSANQIAGMKVNHPMALAGEKQVDASRRVVVQKDRLKLGHDLEKSFEMMVRYIAKVIKLNREEVENALIATGSPVGVRNASLGQLNAMVQNRLTQKDKNGEAFRQYISALVAGMFGRQLGADRFFRVEEGFVGNNGEDTDELSSETDNEIKLPTLALTEIATDTETGTILPYQRTVDGGVEKNKSDKDWGEILSGGAQVITAIGGVVGLFTGGQQANTNDSAFDQYNEGDWSVNGGNTKDRNNKWVIWLVVGAVVLVAGYFIWKKFKK